MILKPNTGYVHETPRPSDWIAGGLSGIPQTVNNHMGDWTVFLPTDERQSWTNFETMACVTFSALNCIEAQMRAHLAYQRIPKAALDWLVDNGYYNNRLEFNLSDRFTAKMSGTTESGNTFVNVWDSIRKHGVLPETDWPNGGSSWAEYYKDIPQALKDKAKAFLSMFNVGYEWAMDGQQNFGKHLHQAPLQVAAPTCPGWNSEVPVKGCSLRPNHATMLYRTGTVLYDFDTYAPYRKELVSDYPVSCALKGVVWPK